MGSDRSTTIGDLQGSRQKAAAGEAARAAMRPAANRTVILSWCNCVVIDLRPGVNKLNCRERSIKAIKERLDKGLDMRFNRNENKEPTNERTNGEGPQTL